MFRVWHPSNSTQLNSIQLTGTSWYMPARDESRQPDKSRGWCGSRFRWLCVTCNEVMGRKSGFRWMFIKCYSWNAIIQICFHPSLLSRSLSLFLSVLSWKHIIRRSSWCYPTHWVCVCVIQNRFHPPLFCRVKGDLEFPERLRGGQPLLGGLESSLTLFSTPLIL